MIIKNYKKLATSKMRAEVLDILEAGILAVEPRRMLSSVLSYNEDFNSVRVFNKTYDIMRGRIFVIGGGKAAGSMSEAVEKIIGYQHITAGVVACKDKNFKCQKIKLIKAGHPFPDRKSVRAVKKILDLKDKFGITEGDLVICLISGGASSLLASPVDEISLTDKQKTTRLLMASGASIDETNIVRKHLSKIKGGRLAEFFAPAQIISLVISDVLGDRLDVIGSGPTVLDTSTCKDALMVLLKYDVIKKIPKKVLIYLDRIDKSGLDARVKNLNNTDNYIVGSNQSSLESMAHKAKSLGLKPIIVGNDVKGNPNVTAYKVVRHILQKKFSGYDVLLYAGETNPKLPEKYGRGGRNQQFVAASMLAVKHLDHRWAVGRISTDGIDFNLRVAGALVDSEDYRLAQEKKIDIEDHVRGYNTYPLFKKMGSALIRTGYTGTNVADIMVYRLEH